MEVKLSRAHGYITEPWTIEDEEKLLRLHSFYADTNKKWEVIGNIVGRSAESCRMHWRTTAKFATNRLKPSPYPKYDSPLEMEGDAVIFPDLEFPFHNADFVNRVLDLAQMWRIDQSIAAGDVLHYDSLSGWEPSWQTPNGKGGLDEKQETRFIEFAKSLPAKQQTKAFALLDEIGSKEEDGDPNISEELRVARKAVKSLSQCFKKIDFVLGNHEGRLMRTLHSPMFPSEITKQIDAEDWRIAPYYYSNLVSEGELFRIVHPRSTAKAAAITLASKFQCHILMAHSHALSLNWDLSGRYYAIQMGCCVDELRLPYASQRDSLAPAHKLGAVIVRGGIPWLLHSKVDWKALARL